MMLGGAGSDYPRARTGGVHYAGGGRLQAAPVATANASPSRHRALSLTFLDSYQRKHNGVK